MCRWLSLSGLYAIRVLKGWISIIKPYQLSRLLVFRPYADRTTQVEHHSIIIAIGSRALREGIQRHQVAPPPANHTDVFSVIAEEFIPWHLGSSFSTHWSSGGCACHPGKDTYGICCASGGKHFFFHLITSMTLGMMPITELRLYYCGVTTH